MGLAALRGPPTQDRRSSLGHRESPALLYTNTANTGLPFGQFNVMSWTNWFERLILMTFGSGGIRPNQKKNGRHTAPQFGPGAIRPNQKKNKTLAAPPRIP